MSDELLTHERFASYLVHKLGPEAILESLVRFPRGTSRETWFARYRIGSASAVEISIRADHPGGAVDLTPLAQEFAIYDLLGQTAVPVAPVLWWEEDPEWTPRPFYLRRKVEGNWNPPGFDNPDPAYDAVRIDIAKEHLRKLALVHAVDWKAVGFEKVLQAPRDEADAAHHDLRMVRENYENEVTEAVPVFWEAWESLRDSAPPAPRLCLCKGTNGLGEEVFRDSEIVAMSDWEEVYIGDPAGDLALCQGFLADIERDGEKLWGMEQATEFYREISGIDVTIANIRYYQMLRLLRRIVLGHRSAMDAHRNPNAFIRKAWAGTEAMHMFKAGVAAGVGLIPPVSASRFDELNQSTEMAG